MDRLTSELQELVSQRDEGDVGVLAEYRTGIRWAIARLARGWLIERARTRRLRAELAEARGEAMALRDSELYQHKFSWEADDA